MIDSERSALLEPTFEKFRSARSKEIRGRRFKNLGRRLELAGLDCDVKPLIPPSLCDGGVKRCLRHLLKERRVLSP